MKLFVISNRLPITVEKQGNELKIKKSVGGLASGVSDYLSILKTSDFLKSEYVWMGSIAESFNNKGDELLKSLRKYKCLPVFLTDRILDKFYNGFCNKNLWPLFHSFPSYAEYDNQHWEIYKEVNYTFAKKILQLIEPDDIIWIHDYHLMLLPQMLRKEKTDAKIIFFLHIPFPNFEIYRLLPKIWREELLKGILGSDIVGFHTYEYTQHFLQCVLRFLGYTNEGGEILTEDRIIKVGTFPMGINFQKFNYALDNPQIFNTVKKLQQKTEGLKVIFSVDRLDYTKGVINRLKGYETFLRENPQYLKKVVLILVIVPGRIGVGHYQKTKREIDELVGKINGEFSHLFWTPILYQTQFLSFDKLVAFYNVADVMLVTPLRDGMNLVAKEYIASKKDATGVLVLSEMAGVMQELSEAIIVNPNDISEIASSIKEAMEMPIEEQIRRNKIMQNRLKRYDIVKWGDELIKELFIIKEKQNKFSAQLLNRIEEDKLINEYRNANKRIIFLDYDGTLVSFADSPIKATPDNDLIDLLKKLSEDERNEVVIISGRDKKTLKEWFSSLKINMVAEHGIWIKEKQNSEWVMQKHLEDEWKNQILPILYTYSDRLPGSFIEEKEYSVVLHYRKSNPEQSDLIVKDAVEYLINFTANLDLQILQGNKVVEIRWSGVNKGLAALTWLSKNNYDFILGIGDDFTDEDLFKALPEKAYTIKVKIEPSHARFNLRNYLEVRELLKKFTQG